METEALERKPELVDSLAAVVTAAGLDAELLTIGLLSDGEGTLQLADRTQILFLAHHL